METQTSISRDHLLSFCPGIEGEEGVITVNGKFISFHGRWASHTGYKSLCEETTPGELDTEALRTKAWQLYDEQVAFAFAVGDEHREHGWEKLCIDYLGRIQIRLPNWHKGIVAKTMESYGMVNTCTANNYWTFPSDSGVSLEIVRTVFAPLLAAGSRFKPEQALCNAINRQATANGYLVGTPLGQGAMQAELF